jgi:hypothetical protein
VISRLRKNFIPNNENDHRPHALRDYNTRNVVAIILFLELIVFLIPTVSNLNVTGGMAAVLPGVLSQLTNEEREAKNLNILTISPILNEAAKMKAEDMARQGYFAHISPDGKTPWYWIEKVGYDYQYAGENLAINFSDSKDVTNAWMESPTHKENIVKENYTEIGTGIAEGIYKGKNAIFVVQVYANQMPLALKQAKISKIENKKISTSNVVKNIVGGVKTITESKKVETNVLGVETTVEIVSIKNPNFWQKIFSSPRDNINKISYIIFAIVLFILFLYFFIKMKNHNKNILTNGLVVLAVLGAMFVVNYYVSYHDMLTADNRNYSIDNKNI